MLLSVTTGNGGKMANKRSAKRDLIEEHREREKGQSGTRTRSFLFYHRAN